MKIDTKLKNIKDEGVVMPSNHVLQISWPADMTVSNELAVLNTTSWVGWLS